MWSRDYLMRQFEGLANVLGLILQRKNVQDYDGAMRESSAACRRMLGMDPARLIGLSEETLLALFSTRGVVQSDRCIIGAVLLGEQGEIYGLQGRLDTAGSANRKALALLLEALIHDPKWRTEDCRQSLAQLLAQIPEEDRSDNMNRRLARYEAVIAPGAG